MFRKEMPQHEGMLFVFEQPTTQCFWMKNTLLPLTAAFVADDGTHREPGRHEAADDWTRIAPTSRCASCWR